MSTAASEVRVLDVNVRFACIPDVIRAQARAHPERLAYITPTRSWTFGQIHEISSRVAQGLLAEGVERGDTIACLTKHTVQCAILLLAAGKIGAVLSAMNWRLAARELGYLFDTTRPKVLMADDFLTPVLTEVSMPSVRLRLSSDGEGREDSLTGWARRHPAGDPGARPLPDDSAARLFSSGTTGLPKAVDLSHLGILTQAEAWTPLFGYREGATVHLNVLPTFHVSGLVNAVWMLYLRSCSVCYPQFDPRDWLTAVSRHAVTDSFVVPAMLRAMVDLPDFGAYDLSSLRSIGYGGSPIDQKLLARCMEAFGCGFLQVFGMTECSGTVTLLDALDHVRGLEHPTLLRSVGKPGPHCALKIVDPLNGEDSAPGALGEVWIRSQQNMRGYFGNPAATSAAFPLGRDEAGGWLRSGDAGFLIEGYLYLHDRIKDMIISGGENIYPAEVESVLIQHPAIVEVAVIGIPDEKWGETVKACVVMSATLEASEGDLIRFSRERLAHYKCPTSVDVLQALPRNPSGKVLKTVLREPYWQGHTRRIS